MLRTESYSQTYSHGFPDGNLGRLSAVIKNNHGFKTRNQILESLPKGIMDSLASDLKRIEVHREQFLFQQDDDLNYIYFPETAVVSELHLLDDGRMVEVAISGRNTAIGIASIYDSRQISNCVQATQGGTLVRIESSLLRRHCRVNPTLPNLLHSSLESYIRQISQRAVCNMYHSIEERLCTWLLLVHELSGRKILRLTHEQISRALGVYRPSITCIALELRQAGMIDYKRGGVSILDSQAMAAAACDCYHELSPPYSVIA